MQNLYSCYFRAFSPSFLPRFLRLVFTVVVLLSSPVSAQALSDILVGSFVDDGMAALSRGGQEPLPRRQESLDFNSPLFLDSHGKFLLQTSYENQRTLRVYHGRWDGTHAYSEHLESAVAAPFSLVGGRIQGTASAGYGMSSVDIKARNDKEDLYINDQVTVETPKGGLYLQAYDRLRLGVALVSTNLRNYLEVPLEVEAAPVPFFRLGYKHSYRDDFVADFDIRLSGHSGQLSLRDLEVIDEPYAVLDLPHIIYLKYANEIGTSGNRRVEGRLDLPGSVYLIGTYLKRELPTVNEPLYVDGKEGGSLGGDFQHRNYRVGAGGKLGSHWSIEANYRHGEFVTQGGGVGSSRAVTSFWPSLLIGNYNYLFRGGIASDQYHLGTEYKGDRFSFGFGCQYLDLRPQADLNYWRSTLFGLGRTRAGNLSLTVDRVEMLFLSFGVGYRWQNLAVNYAFGQFIPLATHDRGTTPNGAGASAGAGAGSAAQTTGGGSKDFFSSLGDKVTHNPGGNLQRLMLTLSY